MLLSYQMRVESALVRRGDLADITPKLINTGDGLSQIALACKALRLSHFALVFLPHEMGMHSLFSRAGYLTNITDEATSWKAELSRFLFCCLLLLGFEALVG